MSRHAEELIDDLASRQQGLVARAQLLRAGLSAHTIKYRVRTRRLKPVHRGVYRVGPSIAPYEREMASVLACGPTAVVSHRSAASLWKMLPRSGVAPTDVTIHPRDRRVRSAIRIFRGPAPEPDEVTRLEGIPTTVPARTVIDLAGTAAPEELERALARAVRRDLTNRREVMSFLERRPRRPGARVLRDLLERRAEPALTRSEAEGHFLALVRKARLPPPELNVILHGYEVDFLWRQAGLVVEVDGFAYHSSPHRFERDRQRDGQLLARGFRVVRVTWRQIVDEPEAMLVRLAQTLVAAGPR
jgi:very-short-patch-repair endonuclease